MVKIIILIVLVIIVTLAGCTEETSGGKINNIGTEIQQQPPDDMTWLSPAKVYITNFKPDSRAEWILTVHNGNKTAVEQKYVTTEPDETEVNIKLHYTIYGNKDDIRLESDNNADNLEVIEIAGDDSIIITGFSPAASRITVIKYPYYSRYNISCRLPDNPLEGYVNAPEQVQDWVIITDSTPVLAPDETRDILIAVEMPADAVIEEKNWEFWISVKDATTLGTVAIEICSRSLVTMR